MAFIHYATILCIQSLILTIGAKTILRTVFSDAKLNVTNAIFAVTLSCSCTLFILVFAEITDISTAAVRSCFWQFDLHLLLVLVVLLIPWYQVYSFLRQTRGWRQKMSLYFSCILWAIYMYLFTRLGYTPAPEARIVVDGSTTTTIVLSWAELSLFRVAITGITLISVLSGFGVIHTPYYNLSIFRKPVSERDYRFAQNAYEQTMSMIRDKKSQLSRMTRDQQTKPTGFGRIMFFVQGPEQREYDLLESEIQQLESLSETMKGDLNELARERAKSQFGQTWKGRLWILISHIFSFYCIYKLVVTTVNVVFRRAGTSDPITRMLSLLISHFGISDTAFWAQQLSFWFAGIIVFGSVRGFFQLLTKILRSFSQRVVVPKNNVVLFVAHMMGMYFLSSVLMMQSTLPPEYSHLISSSLSQIEFDFFRSWSDIIFVISWLLVAVVLYVLHQTNDARQLATDFADVQLMSVESGSGNML
ncbi:Abscisic acid G-protein coupled receptor-domain-containing protein [Zychaea mexicana]|uniref:Abscisic acid G-protein coupled receptor-domain-containing protein n=1 Tax=Zychaea mexicana TaxID=64656 RepID=UPI0022FE45FD|nr:Abscisic acid G-protein coupled receptor-domain-containing protein [Zychaea mexicana]KAI9498155.1 Abscisic acid G-protein coupled receptor-domain-containing protein [Zychaea mexicana]